MNYPKKLIIAVGCCCAMSAQANTYTVDNGFNDTSAWRNWVSGQSFDPKENATPDPGSVSTVYLQDMSFYLGEGDGIGGGNGVPDVVLDIHQFSLLDPITGWDVSSPVPSRIGTSSNILDTTTNSGLYGTEIKFEFDNLALDYNTRYVAMFRDTKGTPDTDDDTFTGLSLLGGEPHEDLSGNVLSTYDAGHFVWGEAPGLDQRTEDITFNATFSTSAVQVEESVPVMGWAGLITLFGLLFGISRYSRKIK